MKYKKETLEKITELEKKGFTIIENRNWKFDTTNANKYKIIIKIAQTNDKMRGYPKRIIWAVTL